MTNEELYYLPASELLKHIESEKERLIKEKVIKKPKPLPPITEEEKPYELPKGWEWIRFGEVGEIGSSKRIHQSDWKDEGVPFLRAREIVKLNNNENHKFDLFISQELYDDCKIKYGIPKINDILITGVGTIGESYIVKNNDPFYFKDGNIIWFKNHFNLNPYYIKYYLDSPLAKSMIECMSAGTTVATYTITGANLTLIPLPPLYIQDEIVQKLEQLFETKDSLLSHAESQLNYTKKMREALLQEAIRGELVPQDENDESASVLLEKIKAEKERLIKEKVIKKQKELPPITEEEKPYELPKGWEWVRLGDAIQFIGGQQPPKSTFKSEFEDGYIRLIQIRDYKTDSFKTYAPIDKCRKFCTDTDVMIGRYGPPIFQILRGLEGAYNVALMKAEPYSGGFDLEYVFYLLKQPLLLWELERYSQRTAGQDGIDMDVLKNYVVGLPPIEEQKRIVAKLDELMANCDQLEAKAEKMKNYTSKLFEASLKEAFMPE